LELERWRREREREAAASRIAYIDNRIADIDKEKEILLADAESETNKVSPDKPDDIEQKSTGLKIKY
jgi:hypothetical protein